MPVRKSKQDTPVLDEYAQLLYDKVVEMNEKDKTGLSFVEIYKPYSDLYNYMMIKIQQELWKS